MTVPAPPVARGLPLLGSALGMTKDMLGFLTAQYLNLGPVFTMRLLHRRFTVLAGIDANRFLIRDGTRHLRSYEFWAGFNARYGAARSVLSTDGPDHARLRRAMRHGYSRQFAMDRIPALADIARREIAAWPLDAPTPVVRAIQRIVSDQVGTLVGGVSPMAYFDDLLYFVHVLIASQFVPRPALWSRRFRRASGRVDRLYREVMEAHAGDNRKAEDQDRDLIDDLLDLHESDPTFFPEADMKIAVLGPFIAALDTVASTCAFMLYELLRHPDVLARARAEADSLFADGSPTAERLRDLDVTHRAALETMRMYPVAPLMFRTVTNAFEFEGYRIPAGENVVIATTVPHRLPECFPEPQCFDIDRYGPERAEHRRPEAYAPFGLGPHRCLGNGFAEAQVAVTMATLIHQLDLAPVPAGYELKTTQVPLPSPDKSFKVRVVRRQGTATNALDQPERVAP
ncbi:MAG: cytochrome P450 [Candidatus Tectomicrobia bacterium]|nr:cytochrome P450 [Candidatus Tectomicrobia bacterium]